jgi:hypothetical protein
VKWQEEFLRMLVDSVAEALTLLDDRYTSSNITVLNSRIEGKSGGGKGW